MYGLDSMEVDIGRTARGRRSASAGPSSAFFLSKLPMTGIYCEYLDTKAFGLLDIMISLHWQSRFFSFVESPLDGVQFHLNLLSVLTSQPSFLHHWQCARKRMPSRPRSRCTALQCAPVSSKIWKKPRVTVESQESVGSQGFGL